MALTYSLLFITCFIMFASIPISIEGNPHKRATGGQTAHTILTNVTLLLERLVSQNQQISAAMSVLTKGLHLTAGDCSDVAAQGPYVSGIYEIAPWDEMGPKGSFDAFCDITDDASWTVIQRRLDGSVDFFRGWDEYKNGFGDLDGEFWLGLDKLYRLTNKTARVRWQLKVELEDFEGNTTYADYDRFSVGDESTNFHLTVGAYSGTAGNSLSYHNNMPFSTKNRDNDRWGNDCAVTRGGAWWYHACEHSNLNGPYLTSATSAYKAITWYHWKSNRVALKKSQMKIRPTPA